MTYVRKDLRSIKVTPLYTVFWLYKNIDIIHELFHFAPGIFPKKNTIKF